MSDSHYKLHQRPSLQRATEIAQNEDGPGGMKGKVGDCGVKGEGLGAILCTMQGNLATDQSARRMGVGQDTRGSAWRWVKDAGRERDWEKERDRWMKV